MKAQHFFFFSFFHLTSDLFLSFYFHFQSLAFQRSSALKKKQLGRTKEAGLIPLITLSSRPPRHLPLAKVSNFPKPSYSKITQVRPRRARETGVKKHNLCTNTLMSPRCCLSVRRIFTVLVFKKKEERV